MFDASGASIASYDKVLVSLLSDATAAYIMWSEVVPVLQ
jgi:hypothetical protein